MNKKTEEKSSIEKLRKAAHILKRRMMRRHLKSKRIRQQEKKYRIKMKNQLTGREYRLFLLEQMKEGYWKTLVFYIAAALLCILLLCKLAGAAAGLFSKKSAPETEAATEQTETEKIYPEKDITIGSTGCMLLHSPFIDSYPDSSGNYDFSSVYKYITPYYSRPDFMTCEFEGALAGEESGYSGYPSFKSPDIIIENIRDSGVDLQFLATNHIYDGWTDGFRRTMDVYEDKKIAYTGIRKTEQDKQYYIADVDGVKIGFINYVYETDGSGTNLNGLQLEPKDWNLVNSFDYRDTDPFYLEMQENIDHMKQEGAQFIIAQLHWGIEYQLTENDDQRKIAQKLADMGVDAIIGGHPHCEQPVDVFTSSSKDHTMFCIFSEGNALSNQRTYLMDEMPTGHTEDGAMITLTLHQDKSGKVTIRDISLLATWVYRWSEESGSKYYILPLDDVEHIEQTTGISGIREEAEASYNRTMEELMPGIKKALKVFAPEAKTSVGI